MIFINNHGEAVLKNGGRGIHIWTQDNIQRVPNADGNHVTGPALCGAELDDLPIPGGAKALVRAASEVWADSILTYLDEEDRMCEECRVRAAVYLGLIEDVDVWARTIAPDQCSDHSPPAPAVYRIEGVKGDGIVVRRAECPECEREICRDEVTIPDPDRRPFDRR